MPSYRIALDRYVTFDSNAIICIILQYDSSKYSRFRWLLALSLPQAHPILWYCNWRWVYNGLELCLQAFRSMLRPNIILPLTFQC